MIYKRGQTVIERIKVSDGTFLDNRVDVIESTPQGVRTSSGNTFTRTGTHDGKPGVWGVGVYRSIRGLEFQHVPKDGK